MRGPSFKLRWRHGGHESSANSGSGWRRRVREVWQAFGATPRAFRLVWDCSWPVTLAMAGLTLVAAALPAAQAWVAKLIVDGVVSSIGQGVPPAQGLAHVGPHPGPGVGLLLTCAVVWALRPLAAHLLP